MRRLLSSLENRLRCIMTVQEIYEQAIRPMPLGERLQLATIILNDIAPSSLVDESDAWTEEDLTDFSQASWKHVERSLGEAGNAETG